MKLGCKMYDAVNPSMSDLDTDDDDINEIFRVKIFLNLPQQTQAESE